MIIFWWIVVANLRIIVLMTCKEHFWDFRVGLISRQFFICVIQSLNNNASHIRIERISWIQIIICQKFPTERNNKSIDEFVNQESISHFFLWRETNNENYKACNRKSEIPAEYWFEYDVYIKVIVNAWVWIVSAYKLNQKKSDEFVSYGSITVQPATRHSKLLERPIKDKQGNHPDTFTFGVFAFCFPSQCSLRKKIN